MRFDAEAPRDVMEQLFVELMLWGKAQGYATFDLGVAPMSGLEARRLAPLWSRIGALAFRYGEHFYNFQGLRRFKDKFDPEWEPIFLAARSGVTLPLVMRDIAILTSGGMSGLLWK